MSTSIVSGSVDLRIDLIELQLYYLDRVTLVMTLENRSWTHSQASPLTLVVNSPLDIVYN